MISLEEEAEIIGESVEKVAELRRANAVVMDNLKYMGVMFLGSLGTIVGLGGAHYYHDKDLINTLAFSGIALISSVSAIKSIYELGRFAIHSLSANRNPEKFRAYLSRQYPDASLLPPTREEF